MRNRRDILKALVVGPIATSAIFDLKNSVVQPWKSPTPIRYPVDPDLRLISYAQEGEKIVTYADNTKSGQVFMTPRTMELDQRLGIVDLEGKRAIEMSKYDHAVGGPKIENVEWAQRRLSDVRREREVEDEMLTRTYGAGTTDQTRLDAQKRIADRIVAS